MSMCVVTSWNEQVQLTYKIGKRIVDIITISDSLVRQLSCFRPLTANLRWTPTPASDKILCCQRWLAERLICVRAVAQ